MIDGKLWFVAVDVLVLVGLSRWNSSHIKNALDTGEWRTLAFKDFECHLEVREYIFPRGAAGQRASRVSVVSESGLYKFLLRAQRSNPAARDFQDWVTKEVLPRIRKNGAGANVSAHFRDRSVPMSKPARFTCPHLSSHFRDCP